MKVMDYDKVIAKMPAVYSRVGVSRLAMPDG